MQTTRHYCWAVVKADRVAKYSKRYSRVHKATEETDYIKQGVVTTEEFDKHVTEILAIIETFQAPEDDEKKLSTGKPEKLESKVTQQPLDFTEVYSKFISSFLDIEKLGNEFSENF